MANLNFLTRLKSLKVNMRTDLSVALGVTDLIDATLTVTISAVVYATAPVNYVAIQAQAQAIRWTDDGTTPTSTVGNILAVGDTLVISRDQFARFKLIQATAGAAAAVTAYQHP